MAQVFGRRVVEGKPHPVSHQEPEAPRVVVAAAPDLSEARDRVRESVMQRIEPSAAARMAPDMLRAEISRIVGQVATELRAQLNAREQQQLADEMLDDMAGLGPLERLLADESITDIMINGPNQVWVERRGKLELLTMNFRDNQHLANIAQRIASNVGRRVDESSPLVDARLNDGSRVNIVLPPIALNGPVLSIRKFSRRSITLDMMARQGNLSEALARFLELCGRARLNIVISGGTGSGKTTLLNAISRSIDPGERIVTIEDAAELQLQQAHVVSLETRPPNLEGVGEINQRDLIRNALRMRPDRIILGECRGGEAFDMLQAMNTGHDGSMSTVHANTPRDAVARLESMVLMGNVGLPLKAIRNQVSSAIDLIVQVDRMRDGVRRIQQVSEVMGLEGEIITIQDLFVFRYDGENRDGTIKGTFVSNRYKPHFLEKIVQSGLDRRFMEVLGLDG